MAPRQWYAGSLDYVSTNPWGELREERNAPGKAWLLVDFDTGAITRMPVAAPRRFVDLPWLDAEDMTASEVDRLLAGAVASVAGGIDGAVVRQVVRNVPRAVARELDHVAGARVEGGRAALSARPAATGAGDPARRQRRARAPPDVAGTAGLVP